MVILHSYQTLGLDDVPILIHCLPQIVVLASDGDKYFINVPDIPELSLFPAQRSSIGRSNLMHQYRIAS
jgi:hypothetical protein